MKYLLLFLFVTCLTKSQATDYYVSSAGDDGRSPAEAQHSETPWKSLSRVSAVSGSLKAGDRVLFKRGEIFAGTLTISASGSAGAPIVFGAYGEGALPELTGFAGLSGWQQKSGNIWEAAVPGGLSYMNTVLVNGRPQAVGRYPNASAANGGYLSVESFNTNTSITDSKLSGQNWSGGQVVIRKNRWILDKNEISAHSGSTINYSSSSGYWAAKGYGYFIQNHAGTLDEQGEWYYHANEKKLGLYTTSNPNNSTIRAGVSETLVRLSGRSSLLFENLRLSGAALSAFEISSCQDIRISGCQLLYSGKNAIEANNSSGLMVENSTIAHTGNNACSINNCSATVLRNNQIRSTGMVPGMGDSGDGTCEGITISGENNLVTGNTIDSTGYIALNFSGNNITIKNNVVSNFTLVKDDGGGIYTWNNGSNAPQNSARVVTGNIVLNGKGAPQGTDNTNKSYAHGIYIDDNAAQVELSGNTVANCASYGVYVHNAHDIAIKENTLYNNAVQLVMEHDNVAADKPIYNCRVTGNVLFAKEAGQLSAEYKTKDNDIANFGTFDSNYYYRPLEDDLTIGVLQQVNGVYSYQLLSLESWQALYGKDRNAVRAKHTLPAFTVKSVTGSNQFANGAFERNTDGLYAYASAGNCKVGWESGKLDGGALKVSFSSTTSSSNYGSVIMGIGAVTAGKSYRLSFSMLGSDSHKAVTAYLRQSGGSYSDLSERKSATISSARLEKSFLFTANATEANASLVFDVPEQSSAVYFDNIKLEPVQAALTKPDQFISLFVNSTTADNSYSTNGQSYDAAGNSYTDKVKLSAFSSVILVQDTASEVPVAKAPVADCSATGTILREQWDKVGGTSISDIPLQKTPSSTSQLTSFEGPKDVADNYGSRIRGYICPPQTGNYTFWIASDDAGELWLSTDDNPSNKTRIANVDGWTNYREWGKYASQKSKQITLEAGKKYYIEALQKEGGGGDNLSVQWQLPDATMETPIAGSHLSPYVDTTPAAVVISGTGTITREQWDNVGGTSISDIPLQKTPSSTSQLTSFEGPKDAADNYGSRIRGYIYPPQNGSYTFWIASDDAGELWLSTDENPSNKTKIANVDGWTNYREWGKYASQKSKQITLEAGKKYYIEALQKDGGGGDNLSVQWQLPDASMETPIAGSHLSPFTTTLAEQTISFETIASKTFGDTPFILTATASSGLPVSFKVVTGSATVSGNTLTLASAGNVIVEASQAGNADFSSAKTVTQSFTVLSGNATCSATGTILREQWSNVSGNNITDIPLQNTPTSTSQLTAFEGPMNIGDNYADRIRGYICAPQSGNYTFWLAADDAAELYLSTDDNPANKVRIANLLSWTNYHEWNKFASQKSASVNLVAGKKYYIEALHKQGGGGDNLSVQWQLPGGTIESPLPGKYLSPYISNQLSTASFSSVSASNSPVVTNSSNFSSSDIKIGLFVYPNPVSQQSNVEFTLPEPGETTVVLYNTKGQLVSRLYSGTIAANQKVSVILNADILQNGVYVIRLISGKNSLVKKVVVMK